MYISRNNNHKELNPELSLGKLVERYMTDNDLSHTVMASLLSINRKTLSSILDGGDLKLSSAAKIAKLLNMSNEDILRLYLKDASMEDVNNIDKASKASFIFENFDLNSLKEAGLIKNPKDIEAVEEEICRYFGYTNIYQYNSMDSTSVLYSKSRFTVNQEKERKMQKFWIKSAFAAFTKIGNPNPYDETLLEEFLKRIKVYTKDLETGFAKVQLILFKLGVTVLVQPYMTKTKAFGISMIVDNKPCIVITDQGKKYHKLWLTLFHELYHIINDYEYIVRTNYHISDPENPDIFVSEEDADMFALNLVLPESIRNTVFKLINSPLKVSEAAIKLDIHHTMIYGVYLEMVQKDHANREYAKFSKFLKRSDQAIKDIVFDPVQQNGIAHAVSKMEQQLNIISA